MIFYVSRGGDNNYVKNHQNKDHPKITFFSRIACSLICRRYLDYIRDEAASYQKLYAETQTRKTNN